MMLSTIFKFSDARSPAALQLVRYTTAAQRAAGERGLVPHALAPSHENAPAASADSAQGRNL
jgi:hypothetical protein